MPLTDAEKRIEYYEHEDFKSNYAFLLLHDGEQCIKNIQQIAKKSYTFWDRYDGNIELTHDEAEEILDYIQDNIEEFIRDFSNYYVGDSCVDSISFGEQEEQLPENADIDEWEDAGFYVDQDRGFAYYDLSSSGVYVEFFAAEIPVLKEIMKRKKSN